MAFTQRNWPNTLGWRSKGGPQSTSGVLPRDVHAQALGGFAHQSRTLASRRAVERKVHGGGIYNNLAAYYATWYHKFSKTPTWPTVLPKPLSADVKEALTSFNIPMMKERDWYQYERKVPNVNNPIGVNLLETGANGAVFKQDFENAVLCPFLRHRQLPGKADRQHNYLSIRNKFFDDYKGQRTGYKTRYTEHLFGWDTGWAARSCFVPNCVTSALTTPRPTKTA